MQFVRSSSVCRSTLVALITLVGTTTSTAQTVTWLEVAREGRTFSVSGTQLVRYGAKGTDLWVQKAVTGVGTCNVAYFGSDPAFGKAKVCEQAATLATPEENSWLQIAREGQTFSLSGTHQVRYGAKGTSQWVEKSISGPGTCTVKFFGSDPAVGKAKVCEQALTSIPSDGRTWQRIANEGQAFSLSTEQQIRYGATGTSLWVEKSAIGAGTCTVAFFGSDPAFGKAKVCERAVEPSSATDTQGPTMPGGLTATAASASGTSLRWTASSDNVGVTAYRIYRDGVQVGSVSGLQYSDDGLLPSRTYRYAVAAVDAAGNLSAPSIAASVTTLAPAGTVIQANPGNYLDLLARLQPGQTLQLAAGRYGVDANGKDTAQVPGLPIFNLNGTAAAPIVITGPTSGPPAVLVGRGTHNTVRLSNASHIIVRHLDIDGRDLRGFGVRAEGVTHDITLEYLNIYGVGGNQQVVGIAANSVPAWNWVIRRNRIVGAGTGMYLGSSAGNVAFVSALIEHNLVQDSIGYNIQLKHQTSWASVPPGLPTTATTTTVRHNVFSKRSNYVSPDGARPNLLIGDVPATGPGSGNAYNIYGNFFYQNPTEALVQAEGRIAFHDNLLVNSSGTAIRMRRHNGAVRNMEVYGNTIVARDLGISLAGGLAGSTQRVVSNAVFAATPLSLSGADVLQSDNVTGTQAAAATSLNAPAGALGQLDLAPKSGQLQGPVVDLVPLGTLGEGGHDFNGAPRNGLTRGAYATTGLNAGWRVDLDNKP